MTYVWVFNEQYGVQVKEGSYAEHWVILEHQPKHLYDLSVRGYAQVNLSKKQVRLMLSEANAPENAFFPQKAFLHFRKQYPKFQVIQDVQRSLND
jgi:hypothetical protein